MSIEGQGHFFTIYFPGFVCFVLYWAKISGERLQDHWSSGPMFSNRHALANNTDPYHAAPDLTRVYIVCHSISTFSTNFSRERPV